MNYKEQQAGGTIRLIKKDAETGKTLFGAIFGIYRVADNEMVGEITSGLDGIAQSIYIPAGYYYVSELRAPDGYKQHNEKIFITVSEGEVAEVVVKNERLPDEIKMGHIQIIKTDITTGAKLSGAVFGVYESITNKKVAELITGTDGTAKSKALPIGEYYLIELKAPIGYAPTNTKNKVIVSMGKTTELILSNQRLPNKTGTITLQKEDKENGKKLAGATFGIYQVSDNIKVGEMTTGLDGTAQSTALPFGDYYLVELRAPDGYILESEKHTVHIESSKPVEITLTNQQKPSQTGTINLIKKDKESGEKLAGATFGVYQVTDNDVVQ